MIFISIIVFNAVIFCLGQNYLPNSQYLALEEMFNGLDGESWSWRSEEQYGPIWFSNSSNPCNIPPWQGLSCSCYENICNITQINLRDYDIVGSFPDLSALLGLTMINMSQNSLSGILLIDSLMSLETVLLSDNRLAGTISPNICLLPKLSSLALSINQFTGSLPVCIVGHESLLYLDIGGNSLTGQIPSALIENSELQYFIASLNYLTGPIPGIGKALVYFLVDGNYLTGSIPYTVFPFNSSCGKLDVSSNLLTGTIPSTINQLAHIQSIGMSYNYLSGTIPKQMSQLEWLVKLFLSNNRFTGPVGNFYNYTVQKYYANVDVSSNYLTGSLPGQIFTSNSLQTFAAGSNCIVGSIPGYVCQATSLTALVLDGLHSAEGCQKPIFGFMNGYDLEYNTPGTLPSCLMGLNSITTLRAGGNGLTGLLSSVEVSDYLQDLDLSFNKFSGTIPTRIGNIPTIDISYNRLEGALPETTLGVDISYQVNRLSGPIPLSYKFVDQISILNGNHLSCDLSRSTLPQNDLDRNQYQCGSESEYLSVIVWGSFVVVGFGAIGLIIVLMHRSRLEGRLYTLSVNLLSWALALGGSLDHPHLKLFKEFLISVRLFMVLLTCFVVFVFLPTYLFLSAHYSTYQDMYIWYASSLYLGGEVPAVVIFVLEGLFILLFFALNRKIFVSKAVDTSLVDSAPAGAWHGNFAHFWMLCAVGIVNAVTTVFFNIVFVLSVGQYSTFTTYFLEAVFALYKLIWNDYVLPQLMRRAWKRAVAKRPLSPSEEKYWQSSYVTFAAHLAQFNLIAVPCLATMLAGSFCFRSVLFPPRPIEDTYPYVTCAVMQTPEQLQANYCPEPIVLEATTFFSPPFIYSYQCSFSLATTYCIVFVFQFILSTFFEPVWFIAISKLTAHVDRESKLHQFLASILPPINLSPRDINAKKDIFQKDRFVLKIIKHLSVFLTYGVVFPPLAVMACVSLLTFTVVTQLRVGRLLHASSQPGGNSLIGSRLNSDVQDIALLLVSTIQVVIPAAGLFYAFFLFDIYGDTNGYASGFTLAIWMLAVSVFTALCYVMYNTRVKRILSFQEFDNFELSYRNSRLTGASLSGRDTKLGLYVDGSDMSPIHGKVSADLESQDSSIA